MTYQLPLWGKAMMVSVAVQCCDHACTEVLIWPNKRLITVSAGPDDEAEADFAEVGKEVDISVRCRLHCASRIFPLRLFLYALLPRSTSSRCPCATRKGLHPGAQQMSASVRQF